MVGVKLIVNQFICNGKLVTDAKNVVNSEEVFSELVYIEINYMCLPDILEGLVKKIFSVKHLLGSFKKFNLGKINRILKIIYLND